MDTTSQPNRIPLPVLSATAPAGAVTDAAAPPVLLAGSRDGLAALAPMIAAATEHAARVRRGHGPFPAGAAADVLAAATAALGPARLPLAGLGDTAALRRVTTALFGHGLDLAHPHTAAHLQPPPLAVAVAADALASAGNASLDTYDSGPSAIAIERWVIGALTALAGLGTAGDGVLTPGGSLSNLLGLLLARDATAHRHGLDARRHGIAALPQPLVFCSELAHFSVQRACAALGLGERAVRTIATDDRRRMCPDALAEALDDARGRATVVAIVATAGTTDFGSVDPIEPIADLAAQHGAWLHVDAAYGFGALFSSRLAPALGGLHRADSITLDLHKLGWLPAAASVLLVGDGAAFAALEREVAYLNPRDDSAAGLDGLLGRSLQTTRRPDAAKIAAAILAHGRDGLGAMVDRCHHLARHAQARITREPLLELVAPAELTTVVFRYRGVDPALDDAVNAALRRTLLERGRAVIGRTSATTRAGGAPHVCLKLTLLNPTTTTAELDELLDLVLATGRAIERRHPEAA